MVVPALTVHSVTRELSWDALLLSVGSSVRLCTP